MLDQVLLCCVVGCLRRARSEASEVGETHEYVERARIIYQGKHWSAERCASEGREVAQPRGVTGLVGREVIESKKSG